MTSDCCKKESLHPRDLPSVLHCSITAHEIDCTLLCRFGPTQARESFVKQRVRAVAVLTYQRRVTYEVSGWQQLMTLPNVRPPNGAPSVAAISRPAPPTVCLALDDFFQGSDGRLNDSGRSESINLVALRPRH